MEKSTLYILLAGAVVILIQGSSAAPQQDFTNTPDALIPAAATAGAAAAAAAQAQAQVQTSPSEHSRSLAIDSGYSITGDMTSNNYQSLSGYTGSNSYNYPSVSSSIPTYNPLFPSSYDQPIFSSKPYDSYFSSIYSGSSTNFEPSITSITSNQIPAVQNSIASHVRVIKRVIQDIVALVVNSVGLVPASLGLGYVNSVQKLNMVRNNLNSLQQSYYKLLYLVHSDLSGTTSYVSTIPGFELLRFILHVPVILVQTIKNFLYKVLYAVGLAY